MTVHKCLLKRVQLLFCISTQPTVYVSFDRQPLKKRISRHTLEKRISLVARLWKSVSRKPNSVEARLFRSLCQLWSPAPGEAHQFRSVERREVKLVEQRRFFQFTQRVAVDLAASELRYVRVHVEQL